jgi:flagellar biosynthesis protein FlhF
LKGVSRSRVHQVISAITRDQEAREQVKTYSVLKPGSLMFTRLDETSSFGNIYSLSGRAGLPVSVFSTGRKVTEQWENASAERLTASILNIL